jgi:hypothetical protein
MVKKKRKVPLKKKRKDKSRARKKKVAARRTPGSRATRGSKKTSRKKAASGKKAARGKAAVKRAPVKKAAIRKTSGKRKGLPPATDRNRARRSSAADSPWAQRGLGAEAGGQSGDTEGLSRAEIADSESVEELLEEGQAFEAGVVSGVENAPDADKGGVRTRQVPEDDVPQEYLDED